MGKKRLLPKIKEDTPKPRPFYGSGISTSRQARGKKVNCICTNYKCKYSSRVWIWNFANTISQKYSNFSLHCPIHQTPLLSVGCASTIPKVGSKERRELILKLIKL
jgi:hypothetical protein